MEIWKYGNIEILENENMKQGKREIGKYRNMEIQKFGIREI